MIDVRHVSYAVGTGPDAQVLIKDASFRVERGAFTVVIGPSGCGKSTLLGLLAGNLNAAAGAIEVAGVELPGLLREYPLAIGYVSQFPAFHPLLTVREILKYALELRLGSAVDLPKRDAWLAEVAEVTGLSSLLGHAFGSLSGGQRKRLALAEELMGDPPVLLLDELTSGLDPAADREMMALLRTLAVQLEKTVVLVTHHTGHIGEADQVILLQGGVVLYDGPPARILQTMKVESMDGLYDARIGAEWDSRGEPVGRVSPGDGEAGCNGAIRTVLPPGGWRQLPVLCKRLGLVWGRDRSQLLLHLALILSFPVLVVIFALDGLPEVRRLSLELGSVRVQEVVGQLATVSDSLAVASLVSGLAMFQIILLILMGANNGAREIVRERPLVVKELRHGLSVGAFLATKVAVCLLLSVLQAGWMTLFVRWVCQFPGDGPAQFLILFLTTLAMSLTCLAVSAFARTSERASLASIYFVGLQLPLSGAVLALPDTISTLTRPFIAAYWGWSGYLRTMIDSAHYDAVRQATDTAVASYPLAVWVLAIHCCVALCFVAWFVSRIKHSG